MKITNLQLFPNHTFRMRKLTLEESSASRAMSHRPEALLVRGKAQKFNPEPVVLLPTRKKTAWDQLLEMEDPIFVQPKKVSRWSMFTGDNPFLEISSAGSILPMPESPDEKVAHHEVMRWWEEVRQAAISSKGVAAKSRQAMMLSIQIILAGICALAGIAAALAMLPSIMERFD